MKRLLFFLFISVIFSCKDQQKTTETDDTQFTALAGTKKIDKAHAEEMKNHFKNPGKSPSIITVDWSVYDALVRKYKEVLVVPARYRLEDEQGYRTAWGITNESHAGDVEDYRSFILQCIPKDGAATEEPEYYHFAQICPPPEDANGNCATYMFKTSDSSSIADSAKNIKIDSIKK